MITKHYLWLFAIGLFALYQSTQLSDWSVAVLELVVLMPYLVLSIGVFISLWLNRIQPVLILLTIGFVNAILGYYAPSEESSIAISVLLPVLSLLFPINLLVWLLLPEKGIYNRVYNGWIVGLFLLQAAIIFWLMTDLPLRWIEPISQRLFEGLSSIQLPFAAIFMFLMAGFALSFKLRGHQVKVLYHAVLVVLLLMGFGLNQIFEPGVLALMSTFSAVIILLSVVFDSHHIAYTDELTGIRGRRSMVESFLGLGKKYSIAMVDIDHFKNFNDRYGHDIGDEVLRTVAEILDSVEAGGRAYRYGGEEFALVFPGRSTTDILHELERLRSAIAFETLEFKTKGKLEKTNVTISIGVAQSDANHKTPESVLKFADEGLYKAKKAGRNKVVESAKNIKGTQQAAAANKKPESGKSAAKKSANKPVKKSSKSD